MLYSNTHLTSPMYDLQKIAAVLPPLNHSDIYQDSHVAWQSLHLFVCACAPWCFLRASGALLLYHPIAVDVLTSACFADPWAQNWLSVSAAAQRFVPINWKLIYQIYKNMQCIFFNMWFELFTSINLSNFFGYTTLYGNPWAMIKILTCHIIIWPLNSILHIINLLSDDL